MRKYISQPLYSSQREFAHLISIAPPPQLSLFQSYCSGKEGGCHTNRRAPNHRTMRLVSRRAGVVVGEGVCHAERLLAQSATYTPGCTASTQPHGPRRARNRTSWNAHLRDRCCFAWQRARATHALCAGVCGSRTTGQGSLPQRLENKGRFQATLTYPSLQMQTGIIWWLKNLLGERQPCAWPNQNQNQK